MTSAAEMPVCSRLGRDDLRRTGSVDGGVNRKVGTGQKAGRTKPFATWKYESLDRYPLFFLLRTIIPTRATYRTELPSACRADSR
jgi:hypothetical protein